MKIDKNTKTPLYGSNEEVPQKLRPFYASTATMGDKRKFDNGYDNIKWNNKENADEQRNNASSMADVNDC